MTTEIDGRCLPASGIDIQPIRQQEAALAGVANPERYYYGQKCSTWNCAAVMHFVPAKARYSNGYLVGAEIEPADASDHNGTADEMIRFLSSWSDGALHADWRSALPGAPKEVATAVRAYVTARRKAPGFRRNAFDSNNHRRVSSDVVADIKAKAKAQRLNAVCVVCGVAFHAQRSSARYCGGNCQRQSSRARATAQMSA